MNIDPIESDQDFIKPVLKDDLLPYLIRMEQLLISNGPDVKFHWIFRANLLAVNIITHQSVDMTNEFLLVQSQLEEFKSKHTTYFKEPEHEQNP